MHSIMREAFLWNKGQCMRQLFIIQRKGFTAAQADVYVVKGFFAENYCGDHFFRAFYGMEELETELFVQEGAAVYRRYQSLDDGGSYVDREYFVCIKIPYRQESNRRLRIFECQGRERVLLLQPDRLFLEMERKKLNGNVDSVRYLTNEECKKYNLGKTVVDKQLAEISGWVLAADPILVELRDSKGVSLKTVTETVVRRDIEEEFPEFFSQKPTEWKGFSCGFRTVFEVPEGKSTIRLADGQRMWEAELEAAGGEINLRMKKRTRGARVREFYGERGLENIVKGCLGLRKTKKSYPEICKIKQPCYHDWRIRAEEKQAEPVIRSSEKQPFFSIVVPLFLTKQEHLQEMIASVQAQTYSRWELCLSDGGGEASKLGQYLHQLCDTDTRIRVVKSVRKLGISENTNAALKIACGDYIVFMDHDDLLHPEALAECASHIQVQPDIDLIYTDEDKVSVDGNLFFQPHFKPDYNRELLHSMNYFCHLVTVKRSLQQQVGLLNAAFDGAQDYDFVLRCTEQAKKICHIPRVLYHWRAHLDSTAENPESKRYAFEAGKRALNAHYKRCGIPASAELDEVLGMYRKVWEHTGKVPLISVILHGKAETKHVFLESQVEVIYAEQTDAAALNAAVQKANGELLLFWSTELEEVTQDGLRDMADICQQDGVAAVGPKVIYTDGRIRQCGEIYERDGGLYRAFEGFEKEDLGYFARINTRMEVSLLLKECLMVKRCVFEEMGGFDSAFGKDYFDADFCLRVRKKGMRNVYCPTCVCTLPYMLKEEKSWEARQLFMHRWKHTLAEGDPNYNLNLSVKCADYSLRLQ